MSSEQSPPPGSLGLNRPMNETPRDERSLTELMSDPNEADILGIVAALGVLFICLVAATLIALLML